MRAVVITSAGADLQLQDVPQPEILQPTELRVRVRAASVNPVDLKIHQRGSYLEPDRPAVLGLDGAGVVESVGPGVRHFSPGDEVYFCHGGLGGMTGTYADYLVLDERFAAPKPNSLSFTEAAAAPLVLITAWEALYDRARLAAGQRVLIHGGAGGVGHVAIQLAQLKGAQVCTTISSEAKANLAGLLGADHCIYYNRMAMVAGVNHWTGDQGVDVAFDTVGEPVLSETFPAVRFYGDVVTLHSATADTDWAVARTRNLRVGFTLTLTPKLQQHPEGLVSQARILYQCAQWIEAGKINLAVDRVFPLEQVAAAHRYLASGSVLGKVVLKMD